jgi:hypothetical protein
VGRLSGEKKLSEFGARDGSNDPPQRACIARKTGICATTTLNRKSGCFALSACWNERFYVQRP